VTPDSVIDHVHLAKKILGGMPEGQGADSPQSGGSRGPPPRATPLDGTGSSRFALRAAPLPSNKVASPPPCVRHVAGLQARPANRLRI
jgi:hypothetical protein